VHVHVSFDGVATSQLVFSVLSGDLATTIVPPTPRPAAGAGDLASPQDVIIYLPDSAAGTVVCRASASDLPAATDQRSVQVAVHAITDVTLTLVPTNPTDGGTDAPPPVDSGSDGGSPDLPPTNRDNGAPCTDGSQCATTYCANNVCCNSSCVGTCRACNLEGSPGTCTAIPAGQPAPSSQCTASDPSTCGADGTCDGMGGCTPFFPAGTECHPSTCVDTLNFMPASRCDGVGNCMPATTMSSCDPFQCNSATGKCFTSCSTSAMCNPPHGCLNSACGGLKPNGDTCSSGTECNSTHCSDGYCCNIDCVASCVACNIRGSEGTCTALPAGAVDPRGMCTDQGATSCGTSGLCNGTGGCQKYVAGTVCSVTTCADSPTSSTETLPRSCDGNGNCQAAMTMPCGKYVCNGGQCYTSCTSNAQCASGFTCKTANKHCM
jgi:hypothetical protein